MKIATRRALEGAVLGCGAPLGWIAIQLLTGRDPWADLGANPALYLYMLFGTLIVFTAYGFYVGSHEQAYAARSVHDALTGLYNTRHFWQRLCEDLAAAQRLEFPLSVIMADLDRFKAVNDRYGHAGGDVVLKFLAALLREHSRKSDTVARIGGEEFAIVLPFTAAPAAAALAERMRVALESARIPLPSGRALTVTASFGIAQYRRDGVDTPERLLQRADEAMYEAKRTGRNRVASSEAGAEARPVERRQGRTLAPD